MFKKWWDNNKPTPFSKGSHGQCYLLEVDDLTLVAKEFFLDRNEELKREAEMLYACQGYGVQEMIGVCAECQMLVTVFEGQTVFDHMGDIDVYDATSVLSQVMAATARGVKRIVCHNDIQPRNVCIKRRRTGSLQATIIDYGRASYVDEWIFSRRLIPPWVAPEIKEGSNCSYQREVYSVGDLTRDMLRPTES